MHPALWAKLLELFLVTVRAQELCGSRGGRLGLPVPNSPHGLCGRKARLNLNVVTFASDRR